MSQITTAEVAAALEITRAAYQEAMTRAGMLAGKIAEVHAYAQSQLVELAAQDDDTVPAPGPLRTDGVHSAAHARPPEVPVRFTSRKRRTWNSAIGLGSSGTTDPT